MTLPRRELQPARAARTSSDHGTQEPNPALDRARNIGGHVTAIHGVPGNANTFYVGGDGGVSTTTNAGRKEWDCNSVCGV